MSDASAGQIVGGVVGAVIGFVGSGYNPAGAIQGFAIGYGVGGIVDPPDGPLIRAPSLGDQTFQSSAYGTSIPSIDGTVALHGNVIYLEGGKYKSVTSETEQGGKGGGGGATVQSISYFATFAVSLCEAIPGAEVRRVWLGGKLVYNQAAEFRTQITEDVSIVSSFIQTSRTARIFDFYDGTQTEPDERIESFLPAGEAESYEGTAYIIFKDLALSTYGNSMTGCPVKVELATISQKGQTLVGIYEKNFTNTIAGTTIKNLAQSFTATDFYSATYAAFNADDELTVQSLVNIAGSWSGTTRLYTDIDVINFQPIGLNDGGQIYTSMAQAIGAGDPLDALYDGYQARNVSDGDVGDWAAFKSGANGDIASNITITSGPDLNNICIAVDEGGDYIYLMTNVKIYKYTKNFTVINSLFHGLSVFSAGDARMWHDNGILWVGTAANTTRQSSPDKFYRIPADFNSIDFAFDIAHGWDDNTGHAFQTSEFVVIDSVLYRGGAEGSTSGVMHYEQWAIETVSKYKAPLELVCNVIAENSGIPGAAFDTSQLVGDFVRGYIRPVGDARGTLSQLQAAFLFDVIQSGYSLRAVKRGAAPILTIPYGDLAAKSDGGSPVDRLRISRQMDTVLPSELEVRYLDAEREYDTGSQVAGYPTSSVGVRQVDFAMAMNNNEAAQLADVLINASWSERTKFQFSVSQAYLDLVVSDVVSIETPSRNYEVRINSINVNENQTLDITGALSSATLWASEAQGSDGQVPDDLVKFVSNAQSELIDAPMIFNSTDSPGFAVQMRGGLNWEGGSLLRSIDDGQTFVNLNSFTVSGAAAVTKNSLSASEGFVIERDTELNVSTLSGSFAGITEAQMMTGQHWCAYGANGRWEIIRYTGAVLNADESLTLSGFVRGARGTEWATGLHVDGDLVLLLDGSNTKFIGADIERLGIAGNYKSVTFEQSPADVSGENFTYRGINLKPLSPVLPVGNNTAGDWNLTAITRTRYAGSFWTTGTQPTNEAVLSYELDILDGANVVRTIPSATLDFDYSEAQQIEDFGSPQLTIEANAYQLSQRVGRGLALAISV